MAATKKKGGGGTGTGRRSGGNSANLRPFPKGRSGNPGGRPKAVQEVVEIAREITPKALRRLEQIVEDPNSSDVAAVQAAREIFDRAYGKAVAAVAIADVTGGGSTGGADAVSTLLRRVRLFKELGPNPPSADDRPAIDAAADAILNALSGSASKEQLATVIGDWLKREPDAATLKSVPSLPAPDFIASSGGEVRAAEPSPSDTAEAATPTQPTPEPVPPAAGPAQPPEHAMTRVTDAAQTPPPAKPKSSPASMPGFSEFQKQKQAARDVEAERLDQLRQRMPGGQLPRETAYPANSGPGFEPPKTGNFTRPLGGGTGFRRI